jgi:hypothetical protein
LGITPGISLVQESRCRMVAESSQIAVRSLRKTISFDATTQVDASDLTPVA